MDDVARQALCQLVAKYGRDLADDVKRCEGLIRDFCSDNRRDANVLILALKERVPADLLASSEGVPKSALLARLARRLHENLGLDEGFARWAVESWAFALGAISAGAPTTVPAPMAGASQPNVAKGSSKGKGVLGYVAAQLQLAESKLTKLMEAEFFERRKTEWGMDLDPEKRPLPGVRHRSELLPLIAHALQEAFPRDVAMFVRKAVFPFMAEYSMEVADLLAARNEFDESSKYAYVALEVAPYLYEAFRCMADCAFSKGDFNTAIKAYRGTAQIFPDAPDLNYQLGRCYFEKGQLDEALGAFEKELTISGESTDLCIQIGSMHFEKGKQIVEELANAGIREAEQVRLKVGDCFRNAEHWYQKVPPSDPGAAQVRALLEASQKFSMTFDGRASLGGADGSCAACGGTHPGGGPNTISCTFGVAPSRPTRSGITHTPPNRSATKPTTARTKATPSPSSAVARVPTGAGTAGPAPRTFGPKPSRISKLAGLGVAIVVVVVLVSLVRRNSGTGRIETPALPPAVAPVATAFSPAWTGPRVGTEARVEAPQALGIPSPRGFVNDFANVLDQKTVNSLDGLVRDLKVKTTAEIAVVTVDSTQPLSASDYAMKVAQSWKPGEKDNHNGVVFLVAVKDRKTFILTGYGMEGALPDARVKKIIDTVIAPRLHVNDYAGGIRTGIEAMAAAIIRQHPASDGSPSRSAQKAQLEPKDALLAKPAVKPPPAIAPPTDLKSAEVRAGASAASREQEAPQRRLLADLGGWWVGIGHQKSNGTSWSIRMTLNQDAAVGSQVGEISYPSLSCGGILLRKEANSSEHVVLERITYGKGRCVDGGTIRLSTDVAKEHLNWEYYLPNGSMDATATLARE